MKLFLSFLIGVVLSAAACFVYFQTSEEVVVATPDAVAEPSLFDFAVAADNNFTYLVFSPDYEKWKVLLTDYSAGKFGFEYEREDLWGELRYSTTDLTATDGGTFEDLRGLRSYQFCSGMYYCDEYKRKGRGFDLTFWNAKYKNLDENPTFYEDEGYTLIEQTDTYIATYKPFSDSNCNGNSEKLNEFCLRDQPLLDADVAKLMESFTTY